MISITLLCINEQYSLPTRVLIGWSLCLHARFLIESGCKCSNWVCIWFFFKKEIKEKRRLQFMTAYKIADLSMFTYSLSIFFNYYYSVNEIWTAFSQWTNNVSIFDCGYINLIKNLICTIHIMHTFQILTNNCCHWIFLIIYE